MAESLKERVERLSAEWQDAFAALKEAGLRSDDDDPIAVRYRAASDAVNHAHRRMEAAAHEVELVDVVFDGPPGHVAGRFVEVENSDGQSVRVGEWVQRPDGYWVLRMPVSKVMMPA